MRPSKDQWAMSLAHETAKRATCLRRSVGAVLLNARGHVLATGYNGVASGLPHCNEGVERGYASVSKTPVCEHWQSANAFYFDRANEVNPELAKRVGGVVKPLRIGPSTIEGHVSVQVLHYQHACSGANLPSGQGLDACQAIHAEQNALLQCRDVYSIEACYVTTSPCVTCVKMLLNTSCKRIVFSEAYAHSEAREWWLKAGHQWDQLS